MAEAPEDQYKYTNKATTGY